MHAWIGTVTKHAAPRKAVGGVTASQGGARLNPGDRGKETDGSKWFIMVSRRLCKAVKDSCLIRGMCGKPYRLPLGSLEHFGLSKMPIRVLPT